MRTTIDKAGRVVIPKAVRVRRHLAPGTEVEIVEAGDRLELILPDDRKEAHIVEKRGHLVISATVGGTISLDETLALRDELRESRHA